MATNRKSQIRVTAKALLVDGENTRSFVNNYELFEAALKPSNFLEEHLVQCIAIAGWRALRIQCLEKHVMDWQFGKEHQMNRNDPPEVIATRAYRTLVENSRYLDFLSHSEGRAFRAFKDALNLFFKVRDRFPLDDEPLVAPPERTQLP